MLDNKVLLLTRGCCRVLLAACPGSCLPGQNRVALSREVLLALPRAPAQGGRAGRGRAGDEHGLGLAAQTSPARVPGGTVFGGSVHELRSGEAARALSCIFGSAIALQISANFLAKPCLKTGRAGMCSIKPSGHRVLRRNSMRCNRLFHSARSR